MATNQKPWLLQPSTRWRHFRAVPFKQIWVLLAAVFLLFSVIGPYVDLNLTGGRLPCAVMASIAVTSGLNAVLWIIVLSRMSRLAL